jgi:hypothetical protein
MTTLAYVSGGLFWMLLILVAIAFLISLYSVVRDEKVWREADRDRLL